MPYIILNYLYINILYDMYIFMDWQMYYSLLIMDLGEVVTVSVIVQFSGSTLIYIQYILSTPLG